MTPQTLQRIASEFETRLVYDICVDENFHIDFEVKSQGKTYEFVSTLYCEEGERVFYDYDSPPEYKNRNICLVHCNLVEIDDFGDVHYYTDEAEQIIFNAIRSYT